MNENGSFLSSVRKFFTICNILDAIGLFIGFIFCCINIEKGIISVWYILIFIVGIIFYFIFMFIFMRLLEIISIHEEKLNILNKYYDFSKEEEENKTTHCASCGKEISVSEEKCPYCGKVRKSEEEFSYLKNISSESNENITICPKCGYQLFDDEKKCSNCGWVKEK